MESLLAVVAAIGGMTALGAAFDFYYWKDRAKIELWMMKWWSNLDDIRWGNFSRREAQMVTGLIDDYAGARFWSIRRWRFSLITVLVVCLFAHAWTMVRAYCFLRGDAVPSLSSFFTSFPAWQATAIVLQVAFFALSLSVTRAVSVVAALMAGTAVTSVLTFLGLLLVHALLFVVWNVLIFPIFVGVPVVSVLWLVDEPEEWREILSFTYDHAHQHFLEVPYYFGLMLKDPFGFLGRHFSPFLSIGSGGGPAASQVWEIVDLAMGVLANGSRIAIALLFVVSFCFKSVLQPLTLRLWEGLILSGRPVFAILFGMAGGLISGLRALLQ